jgi:hypothetical protein
MAEVYDYPNGEQLERLIARHVKVQAKLDQVTLKAALKAERELNRARHRSGNSRIGIEHGDIDWYVYLEDPDQVIRTEDGEVYIQPGAANVIEYGRPGDSKSGGTKGLHVLHKAVGLPIQED